MAEYTRRVQILLTDEQHEFLQELSRTRRRSVGELLRIAFEEVYRPVQSIRELQALHDLGRRSFLSDSDSDPGSEVSPTGGDVQ